MNIKSSNGCFITAESNGGVDPRKDSALIAYRSNRDVAGPWEDFDIENHPDGRISLLTSAGYYMTAEGGGGSFLRSDATVIGDWEKFWLVMSGDGFSLLCNDNEHYVTCEVGSKDPTLNATRTIIGPWEVFTGIEADHTRDEIINVQANSCNLRDNNDWPIFDPFIDWLIFNNLPKAEDWVDRLRDNGSTHINVDLSGDYNEPLGWAPRYPIPGTDWTNDLDRFKQVLDWLISQNLIPIIHLAADGQGHDPVGMTYGWQWGMDALPDIIKELSNYKKKALWNPTWDGGFPNWSPEQFISFIQMLRTALGVDAQIATEFSGPADIGYIHLGNGSADWDGIMQEIDCFMTENQKYPILDAPIAEVATRLLGPDATNTPTSPFYLGKPRARGRCNMCYFETLMYWAIRKYASPSDARAASTQGKKFGFTSFGNGMPI